MKIDISSKISLSGYLRRATCDSSHGHNLRTFALALICSLAISLQALAQSVAAGYEHTMFVKADGTLWAIGSNLYGQLGDGTKTNHSTSVQVASGVKSVFTGDYHTLFIKNNGTLWVMGHNHDGQLGTGNTTDVSTPVQVANNVAAATAGTKSSLFVKTDGTLWAMGNNGYYQLGDGTATNRSTPVQVASGVASVSTGDAHTMYIKVDGTLWGVGDNVFGQIGDGTDTRRSTAVQVANNVASVSAGYEHTMFVKTDGTLWAMGNNYDGRLGDSTIFGIRLPARVASGVVSVAAGSFHTMFVKTDGTLWAAGSNGSGQLGYNSPLSQKTPVQITSAVSSVAAGYLHTAFMTTDGNIWAVGSNTVGQLGDGTQNNRSTPVKVIAGSGSPPGDPGPADDYTNVANAGFPIRAGDVLNGRISVSDQDAFKFTPTAKGTLTLTFTVTSSSSLKISTAEFWGGVIDFSSQNFVTGPNTSISKNLNVDIGEEIFIVVEPSYVDQGQYTLSASFAASASTVTIQPFSDPFDALDSTRWEILGGTWSVANGRLTGSWPQSQAQTDQGNLLIKSPLIPENYYVEFVAPLSATNATGFVLYRSAGNKYNVYVSNSNISFQRRVDGRDYSEVASQAFSGVSSGSTATVRLTRAGSAFAVAVNGTQLLTYTDSSWSGNLRLGVAVYGTATYDSFTYNATSQSQAAPESLTATAVSAGQIDLSWTDVSGETGYRIERKTGTGAFGALTTKSANVTSHSDSTVAASTSYTYQIRAENASGNSSYTTSNAVTAPAAPATPAPSTPAPAPSSSSGGGGGGGAPSIWFITALSLLGINRLLRLKR